MAAPASLLDLLGRPARDEAVQGALARFRIARQPALAKNDLAPEGQVIDTQDFLLNRRLGVVFGFEDEATFRGEHPDEVGARPMLLTEVQLHGGNEEMETFPGPLPLGLDFGDSRAAAREKLGRWESSRRSYLRDTWELSACRLSLGYRDGDARIDSVAGLLRRPPLPADRDDAALLPDIGRIAAVLGKPLADPELRLALAPLRLDQSLEEEGDALVAGYRLRFGLELRFGHLGGGRAIVLTQVTLFREHMLDAVGWSGGLPWNLTFDDSPETLLRKVRRPPVRVADRPPVGYAVWRFSRHELRVKFSIMENILLRVQMTALTAEG